MINKIVTQHSYSFNYCGDDVNKVML